MNSSARFSFFMIALACILFGAGCFQKERPYIPSSPTKSVNVPATSEGAKASTGGIQATVTPSLETSMLVKALPDEGTDKTYKASVAEEKKNPVPTQDGTRTEFTTVSKTFTKEIGGAMISIQASITDTRSIPVLTAFIQSYAEFTNERASRKKIPIENETAWLTYSKENATDANGFGSVTMLYRNRFLIQIDGNLGVTEDELLEYLRGYHFDLLR
jgi:hypothetical protein